jgi:hypothetical protein
VYNQETVLQQFVRVDFTYFPCKNFYDTEGPTVNHSINSNNTSSVLTTTRTTVTAVYLTVDVVVTHGARIHVSHTCLMSPTTIQISTVTEIT